MSGHSKWASIKHKKGAADAKRGKLFTQLGRAITVAAKKGGGDPKFNFSLRLAIDKAKTGNMPKDNIAKAIKRGTGELAGAEISENRYEGYGPAGIAIIVDTLTDNTNRTFADLKHLFSKYGGNLEGSVAWQFEPKGVIIVSDQSVKAADDQWMLAAIDAGVADVETEEDDLIVLTEATKLQSVKEWLEQEGLSVDEASLVMAPKETLDIEANKLQPLLEALEEHDDVERVFHNANL